MKLFGILIVCLFCYFGPCYSFDCKSVVPSSYNWTTLVEDGVCYGYGELVDVTHYSFEAADTFCRQHYGRLASISTANLRVLFGTEIKFAIKYDTVHTVYDESEAFFWVDLVNRSGIITWGDGRSFKQAISEPKTQNPISDIVVLNGDYEGKLRFYTSYRYYEVRNAICEFEEPEGNSTIEGDPHMNHFIKSQQKSICYDLTGKANDEFLLLNDKKNKLQIYGILLDDYYFHSIKIKYLNRTFIAHTNPLESTISWNKNIQRFESMYIKLISANQLLFTIGSHTSFVVTRSKSIGEDYINIWMQTFNEDRSSGIFGDVANNNYEFFESLQRGQRGSVKVNGQLFPAEYRHEPKNCWFLTAENAFYPKKPTDYITKPF